MKKYFSFILLSSLLFTACGGSQSSAPQGGDAQATSAASSSSGYDPKVGIGKYNSSNLTLGATIDQTMAANGEKIYNLKCFACHKLTDEKLMAPGWKGITTRQTPVWIMNYILNPDGMIDKDPELQKQLAIFLARMPNQNLSDSDARAVLEFMRKNDGVK
jgi:cytochrome c5